MKAALLITGICLSILTSSSANAQSYRQYNNRGSSSGQRQELDIQYQNQTTHQNPRAAVLGGILQAVAIGLDQGNPQKNAGAVQVLGSLGNTFNQISGRQTSEQTNIRYQEDRYQNNWSNQGWARQSQPRQHYRPQVNMVGNGYVFGDN